LSTEEILSAFARLQTIVDKTGGAAEHRGFDLLKTYLTEAAGTTKLEHFEP
jgi:hypothetical protein